MVRWPQRPLYWKKKIWCSFSVSSQGSNTGGAGFTINPWQLQPQLLLPGAETGIGENTRVTNAFWLSKGLQRIGAVELFDAKNIYYNKSKFLSKVKKSLIGQKWAQRSSSSKRVGLLNHSEP